MNQRKGKRKKGGEGPYALSIGKRHPGIVIKFKHMRRMGQGRFSNILQRKFGEDIVSD
jgi:hypothetical protein